MKWKIAAVTIIFLAVALAWILFRPIGPKDGAPPPSPADQPPPSPAIPEVTAPAQAEPPEAKFSASMPTEQVSDLPPQVRMFTKRLRTGARRVAASSATDYVNYAPQAGIRWDKLKEAISEKVMPFEVLPLEEKKKGAFEGGFHVAGAGMILARAIAAELERMGYRASVRVDEVSQQVELNPAEQMRGSSGEFVVFGTIEFRVEQSRAGDLRQAVAVLACDVEFFGRKPAADAQMESLHKVHVEDRDQESFSKLEDASERSRRAAAAVLARAVKKVLGEPGLEPALVAFVEGVGK